MTQGSSQTASFAVPRHASGGDSRARWNKVPEITVYFWGIKILCTTVGEAAADMLAEKAGLGLTGVAVLLVAVFLIWYGREKTLSIHSIDTTSREAFYWLAVLFTFALGTAAGDLVAERMALGYLTSIVVFAAVIAAWLSPTWRSASTRCGAFGPPISSPVRWARRWAITSPSPPATAAWVWAP
jgi:uncharacterized membrane-anchored protein